VLASSPPSPSWLPTNFVPCLTPELVTADAVTLRRTGAANEVTHPLDLDTMHVKIYRDLSLNAAGRCDLGTPSALLCFIAACRHHWLQFLYEGRNAPRSEFSQYERSFPLSTVNRQAGCSHCTLGRNRPPIFLMQHLRSRVAAHAML